MQRHDHSADPYHVVGIGKSDKQYGGQVVNKHDKEILSKEKTNTKKSHENER